MVTGLLDTDILVDLLRLHPPAQTWFAAQNQLGVVSIVWIELLQGATNKTAQLKALRLLRALPLVEFEQGDFEWAVQTLLKYHLSHSLMGFDALIAAVSYRLQVPLYTRNLKHFTPVLGNLAQNPY